MRVFGNLMNRIEEQVAPMVPEIGMGATILMFSDQYPATVVQIVSPKKIAIQEDTATRVDKNGPSEEQEWSFMPNLKAPVKYVTLRKTGVWMLEGTSLRGGTVVRIGRRNKYYDFGF